MNDLHSTMYLLNRRLLRTVFWTCGFTFHYVSIKSYHWIIFELFNMHLHSTMYLLNLALPDNWDYSIAFTFHYVSIKSILCPVGRYSALIFTFHYVSIKSCDCDTANLTIVIFTFHYVSIKSEALHLIGRKWN